MTSILLQSVSTVSNAEVEKRNKHFAAAKKFFSEARDAAERGDASASGQLILRGLEPVSYTHLTLPTNREV